MQEEWKIAKNFENYMVSNFGRIKSLPRCGTKGGIIDSYIDRGYPKVNLYGKDKRHSVFIHKLVATTFIPNPHNLPQINHKDGNKQNNYVDNLEWCTAHDNLVHAIKIGLRKTRKVAQIKDDKVIKIYDNVHIASIETGVNCGSIWQVANGRLQTSHGYKWLYINTIEFQTKYAKK